ncbi:histidine utilization repressor [bacterium]|nr:histidine utilization repressor [bacterium]
MNRTRRKPDLIDPLTVLPGNLQEKPPWPLYQQVKHLIVRRINSGHWSAGNKIPSENELVESLGISRMTINRALRELTAEGILIRKKGAGSFVAPEKPQFALFQIRSIAEEIKEWGGNHESEVILLKREPISKDLHIGMQVKMGTEIYHSLILHKNNGVPIQLADRFVNPETAPDYIHQDFSKITPSEYLLTVAPIDEVEHVIETLLPDEQMIRLLKIAQDDPCLILNRTTWINGKIASQNRFVYPGSRYSLGGRFKASSSTGQLTV